MHDYIHIDFDSSFVSDRRIAKFGLVAAKRVADCAKSGTLSGVRCAWSSGSSYVPVVVQLTIAPLRPVRIAAAVPALRRRWRVLAFTSLLVMTLILLGSVVVIIPGVIAATVYALYAPVVIMEQHGVRGTLRRSWTLSSRAFWTALVITVVQFALPVLVWRAAVTTDFTFRLNDDFSPKEFGFNFSMSGWSGFRSL